MGNRAVITLDQTPTSNSLGIYLHWNGGPESVLAFAQAAHTLGALERVGEHNDYPLARLVQVIGNFLGGNLSLGVDRLEHLDTDNGDNGLFVILPANDGEVSLKQYPRGLKVLGVLSYPPRIITRESVSTHPYWFDKETGEKDKLLNEVIRRNAAPFGGWKENPVQDAAHDLLAVALSVVNGLSEDANDYPDASAYRQTKRIVEGARAAIAKATTTTK